LVARIAICMATFEPRLNLFERQVESIRKQTERSFVCIVSDDGSSQEVYGEIRRICARDTRFVLSRGERRRGVYGNFERALSLAPSEVQYVAFSDQDDVWYPEKVAVLAKALDKPDVLLAYSDMRIVDAMGRLLAPSFWTDRRNNFEDLGSLLLQNTVTGAASLFRRELLELALPFPVVPSSAYQYHDHWLASLALSCGRIVFVPRPLHDYVQHSGNVVGRHEPLPDELKGGLARAGLRFIRSPRRRLSIAVGHARLYHDRDVVPLRLLARELERRVAGRCAKGKRRTIRRIARLGTPSSLLWLLARSARDVRGDSETLGVENQLITGIVWGWLARIGPTALRKRRRRRPRIS